MTFQFKLTDIKGKKYVAVSERIRYLREVIKDYSLLSDYTYYPEVKMWVVKATLQIGDKLFNGHAQEVESEDYKNVNHTSALENAETSAWGRACAAAGIGVDEGVASSDEVVKAVNRTSPLIQGISKSGNPYKAARHEGGLLFLTDYEYDTLSAKIAKNLSITEDLENIKLKKQQ